VTNAVGRETGVADGDGDGVGVGAADTDATRGELMLVGTGSTLPASKGEAVALGDSTAACP
jgi:hypothetical protein